jgi:hypothetical protein
MAARTPEGKVKAKINAVLKRHPCYSHMPVLNGMGAPTLDYIGCSKGRFFAIEAKRDGNSLSPRQVLTAEKMRSAGAKLFVIVGEDSPVLQELEDWLCS